MFYDPPFPGVRKTGTISEEMEVVAKWTNHIKIKNVK